MSTLFMIGNGFDLNCGMKTRYTDVYPGYVETKSNSENISHFKRRIKNDIDNWSDFESAMADYTKEYHNESDFIECIIDFSIFLNNYLKEQENEFIIGLEGKQIMQAVIDEMRDSFTRFYEGVTENVNGIMKSRNAGSLKEMEFVSYNYTKIFDLLTLKAFEEFSLFMPGITHIHGEIDKLVLGMDNEDQIKPGFEMTRSFKRFFIKPIFNEEYDIRRIQQTVSKIFRASTICVFGMSLGASDFTWRNRLIEWLKKDSGNHLFIYDYGNSNEKCKMIADRMDLEEKVKINTFEKWGVLDYDKIMGQLHMPCGKNIFNIQKVINEARKKSNDVERGKKYIGNMSDSKVKDIIN